MAKVMKQNKWSNEKNFNCPSELFLSEFHCTYSILPFATSALCTHTKLPVIWLLLHVILTLVFLNSYYLQVTLLTGTQECLAMKLITFLSFYILTTGNQGSAWKLASVSIPPVKQSWQVTFEAIRGNGVLGDIAIDDFSLSSTGCGGGAYSGSFSLSLSLLFPPLSLALSFSLCLSRSFFLPNLVTFFDCVSCIISVDCAQLLSSFDMFWWCHCFLVYHDANFVRSRLCHYRAK